MVLDGIRGKETMNVHNEINKFANDSDKNALHWLFSKYHMQSQWSFVARCSFHKYGTFSYQINRVWTPTDEGWILYKNSLTTACYTYSQLRGEEWNTW